MNLKQQINEERFDLNVQLIKVIEEFTNKTGIIVKNVTVTCKEIEKGKGNFKISSINVIEES